MTSKRVGLIGEELMMNWENGTSVEGGGDRGHAFLRFADIVSKSKL